MLSIVFGFVVLGFVGIGFLGGSSLFYGETLKDSELIEDVIFSVGQRSNAPTAKVTVYLEAGSSNKKMNRQDQILLNKQILIPEFYNGMSVGYKYVGEVAAATKYDLEIRRKSQSITKSILSREFALTIPDVISKNHPLEIVLEGDIVDAKGVYVTMNSLNDEPIIKTSSSSQRGMSLKFTLADSKLIFSKDQFTNLLSTQVEMSISKRFEQTDGDFVIHHEKTVTIE